MPKRKTGSGTSAASDRGKSGSSRGAVKRPGSRTVGKTGDLDPLLRYAAANPESREKLLPVAEAAYLRLARDLRHRARKLPPAMRAAMNQRATAQYFRAVVARNLPQWLPPQPVVAPKRSRGRRVAPAAAPALATGAPGIPADVSATPGLRSATVSWTARPAAELIKGYTVTPVTGGNAQSPVLAGPVTSAVILGLTPNVPYSFKVHATNLAGADGEDGTSNTIVPTALDTGSGPVAPVLPAFTADPVLLLDPLALPALPLLETATQTAQKWRYEYLKELAVKSATSALQFESHIGELMQMALSKATSAEQMLNSTLIEAVKNLQLIDSQIADLGSSDQLDSLLPSLADVAAQSLLLPRLLEFLATTSPIGFWVGLFEAMISDLAAAIFSSTSFSRTRAFLADTFSGGGSIQRGVTAAANQAIQDLDTQIESVTAPLRAAVSQVVQGTQAAVAEVFESFDLPLLMNSGRTPQLPDVPDVDPFGAFQKQLDSEIGQLTEKIRQAVKERLAGLTSGSDSTLFVAICVTYLVLPILALLVISLAGGPFSAALLAAAVLLAVEELVHLLLSWLTGALLKQVDQLKAELGDIVKKVQQLFARASNMVLNESPKPLLDLLANELRVLRDLAPQTYLDDAASLLSQARNVVLGTARDLAGAAEQAAGQELGTAFETIQNAYDNGLPQAPLLPGGADSGRFASAALLRDLGKLEQQRTTVQDGKELEVTHRLSLARLLGTAGSSLGDFLARRETLIHLDETQLADQTFPGMYRVLIKKIEVSGVFASLPATLPSGGIPLTLTHLGDSSTRIKRRGNPAAPPIDLPDFLRMPNLSEDAAVAAFKRHVLFPAVEAATHAAFKPAFASIPLTTYAILVWGLILDPNAQQDYGTQYRNRLLQLPPQALPQSTFMDVIAAAVESVLLVPRAPAGSALRSGRDFVDPDQIRAAAKAKLLQAPWDSILGIMLTGADAPGVNGTTMVPVANRDRARDSVANALLYNGPVIFDPNGPEHSLLARGLLPFLQPGPLLVAVGEVFDEAVADYRKRIARWGGADLVEDPDPQVRALGFARLVRKAPAEAALFNLLPATSGSLAAPATAQSLPPTADGTPFATLASLQYRPFENRGLDGELLLRVESLSDGLSQLNPPVLAQLGSGGLPLDPQVADQLSNHLSDILLQVTVSGCYDPALAAAVRASRREDSGLLAMAGAVLPTARRVQLPGSAPALGGGSSELRTLRLSLRAHRDRTLRAWTAAFALAPASLPNIGTLLTGGGTPLAPLGAQSAFLPLQTVSGPLTLGFDFDDSPLPTSTNESALLAAANRLRIDPVALGFTGPESGAAGLVGLGLAVIPTAAGTRAEGTLASAAEPLGITWQVDSLLAPLIQGAPSTGAAPLPARLSMTSIAPDTPVRLADLFAATSPAVVVNVPAAAFAAAGPLLYDVILSLSFRVPVPRVSTGIAAIR